MGKNNLEKYKIFNIMTVDSEKENTCKNWIGLICGKNDKWCYTCNWWRFYLHGVIGSRGELANSFRYIDAPILEESQVPPHMISTAYGYCEDLTLRKAGNFYRSF